jgi:hypothetical protein
MTGVRRSLDGCDRMTGAHAFLAPSSASTWGPGGCAAYPRMAAAFPEDEDSLKAREGTAAHHYVSETVAGREPAVGSLAPNGHPITDEMVECGEAMVTDIRKLQAWPGVMSKMEQRIEMPEIHALNWGTADFIAVDLNNKRLYNWDYKYGHRYVDAFENWQLVDYAVGAVHHFHVTITPEWQIDARIYQPRSFHADGPVKRWSVSGARFRELQAQLTAAAQLAADPNAAMTTGPYCADCPARHACPALQRVGGVSMDVSLRGVPHIMEPANAGVLLKMVRASRERLEDLETGLEAQVMAAIRDGKPVPGWEAVPGQGRERWIQPLADVVAMGDMFGADLRKPAEAITPAQARKKGIDEAVISAYSERPAGETKLKPVDGKNVRKAFQ